MTQETLVPTGVYVAVGVHMCDAASKVYVKADPLSSGMIEVAEGETRNVMLVRTAKLLENMARDLRKQAEQ